MCFKKYLKDRRLERQIRRLSEAERQAILEQSPYEEGWFQGEGYHIFQKNEPDFTKAFVGSVGETDRTVAEDWIIRRYFLDRDENRD